MRIAGAPTSWGVDYADAPNNPPWPEVLDGIASAGYTALELGPVGYLPERPEVLRHELAKRGLTAAGTFVFDALHDPHELPRITNLAERAARLVAGVGGTYLLLIDHTTPERTATAGNTGASRRLDEDEFAAFIEGTCAVAQIAIDHGIRALFHPHVGSYVEFEDELDRLLESVPRDLLGLCLDTGHSLYAGIDPCAYLIQHQDRLDGLHLKDIDPVVRRAVLSKRLTFQQAVAAGIFCPLGEGDLNLRELRSTLSEIGFEGFATVEQDRDPNATRSAVEDARESLIALTEAGMTDRLGTP